MRSFVCALAASVAAASSLEVEYMQYVAKYNKSYLTQAEMVARRALYEDTDALIKEVNASQGSFTLAHNKFSDMSAYERSTRLGYVRGDSVRGEATPMEADDLPESVDWRDAGAVTPIKDQGQCGSCWAFSSTGALEGAHFIASGELLSFSEQQLVDCEQLDHGCSGGLQDNAFLYLQVRKAMTEAAYPYHARRGLCKYDAGTATDVRVGKITYVTSDDPDSMKAAIAQQPVSVSIEADRKVFQQYSSGIFDSDMCGNMLDHAVLLVGYGAENGQEYYILKNSWGTEWGEKGYMRMAITEGHGVCGVQMEPLFPSVTA